MCTYNGEKYIKQQLDSILNQSHKDFCIYIRDDGSTDATIDIVRDYEKSNPGKVMLVDSPKHLGYPDCFWDILDRCPKADFYAFSDQDDVWHEDKLARAVESLQKENVTARPLLYIHDYDNCNGNLDLISHHVLGSTAILDDYSVLFYTYASGFCMVIDNTMRDLLLSMNLIDKAMYHDELCIWLAHFHGDILYDDSVLTKYRRHESTVTEYGNGVMTLISNWLRREIFGPEFGYKCKRIRTFIKLEKKLMDDGRAGLDRTPSMSKRVMRDWYLLSGGKRNLYRYFARLFYPMRLRPSVGGEVALRLMFLMNRK
jgi:glycosyltransferase involved in cell wall biosynthesis